MLASFHRDEREDFCLAKKKRKFVNLCDMRIKSATALVGKDFVTDLSWTKEETIVRSIVVRLGEDE